VRVIRSVLSQGIGQDREILRLAGPAFGALVAEPLFLLGDSAIVGRIGTVPLGGLGVASQALTTLVNISIFLAYGTTAAVARQLGAGRPARRSGRVSTGSGWPRASGWSCSLWAGRWPRRAATTRMIGWGAVYGTVFGALVLMARPLLPGLFAAAPPVRALLLAVLLVVAAQQPAAGVVFVLDGVLIGAGRSAVPGGGRADQPGRLPPGRLAGLQPLAAGPVRDAGVARPGEPLADNRRLTGR
jgi:Na+-driven multidrug efflux pump